MTWGAISSRSYPGALRACCKCVVEHVRRLLGVTGKRSSERTQLATLLFSLSRFMPLVAGAYTRSNFRLT